MLNKVFVIGLFAFTTQVFAEGAQQGAAKPAETASPSAAPANTPAAASAATADQGAAPASATDYSCTMAKAKRTVSVVYEKEGTKVPCKVNYVRDAESGESKTLYNAAAKEGYCEEKASEFVEKLKSSGWSCTSP